MAADLGKLNKTLSEQPFIGGFELSGEDAKTFESIKQAPDAKKFTHVARWHRNVSSYSPAERQAWGGASTSGGAPAKEDKGGEDEDFDLFGSEDEDEEKKAEVERRLKEYHEKKAKKPGPIAKSSVILDVKPWDDETNMKEMEDLVRGIEMDGLVWGGGKLIAIGYGISKLQIICVIEDAKVSVDDLIERITTDFESHVQSVDIAAFNKI